MVKNAEVSKKWNIEDLRSGKVRLPKFLRTKSKAELKKEDEEIEKLLQAEDKAKAKTTEGRFLQLFEAPETDELKYWRLAAAINFFLTAWNAVGGGYLLYHHLHNLKYLTLLENYDDGNLSMCNIFLCFINVSVCLYGFAVTYSAGFTSKRGRLRYVLYAYLGWAVALLIVLACSLIFIAGVLMLFPHIFKTGFLMTMLKYKDDPDIQKSVHYMQMDNKCCGNDNYTEWFSIRFSNDLTKTILGFPKSCCNFDNRPKDQCVHMSEFSNLARLTPWPGGCLPVLFDIFKHSIISGIAVIGSTFLGKLAAVAMCISNMRAVKNYEDIVMREREKMMSRKERAGRVARREKIEKHGLSVPPPPVEEKKGLLETAFATAKSTISGAISTAPAAATATTGPTTPNIAGMPTGVPTAPALPTPNYASSTSLTR